MSERSVEEAHFSKDIQELLRLFAKHDVSFVIIGGEAVIFHGYPRYTGDVDFFYEAQPENVGRMYSALLEFWHGDIPSIDSPQDFLQEGIVVQFGRPPNRIDLLSSVDGLSYAQAWAGRERARMGDLQLNFLGLRELVLSKRAAGRAKDLADLTYLERKLEELDS